MSNKNGKAIDCHLAVGTVIFSYALVIGNVIYLPVFATISTIPTVLFLLISMNLSVARPMTILKPRVSNSTKRLLSFLDKAFAVLGNDVGKY